jgi:hypothetical protein
MQRLLKLKLRMAARVPHRSSASRRHHVGDHDSHGMEHTGICNAPEQPGVWPTRRRSQGDAKSTPKADTIVSQDELQAVSDGKSSEPQMFFAVQDQPKEQQSELILLHQRVMKKAINTQINLEARKSSQLARELQDSRAKEMQLYDEIEKAQQRMEDLWGHMSS